MNNKIQKEYEELVQGMGDFEFSDSRPCNPCKKEWTDDVLRGLRRDLHFSHSAYSRNELKKILTRFYYLYCQGCNQEGDNVTATLNDVIAIAQTDHGPIWEAPPPNVDAFYAPNVSQTDNLRMVQVGASDNQNLLRRFCAYVGDIIEDIDPLGRSTENETRLIRLTSFLGLTMYRFATKTSRVMERTFRGTQYEKQLARLTGWKTVLPESPFSPPCDSCLTVCESALAQGLSSSRLFTIVVNEYIDTNQTNYVNCSAREMLEAALLTDTAWYGLGLVQMMQKVTDILHITREDLATEICPPNIKSCKKMVALLNSRTDINNPQYSFYWARVIDHGYFRELSFKENLFLATIFGAIIAEVEGQGVWEAEWTRETV